MAKKRELVTGKSSYEKAYEKLLECEDGKNLIANYENAVVTASIIGREFITANSGHFGTIVEFSISFGSNDHVKHLAHIDEIGHTFSSPGQIFTSKLNDEFFSSTKLKALAKKNFGHGVPTFFCKTENIINGFPQFVLNMIPTRFMELEKSMLLRLQAEVDNIVKSQEFKKELNKFCRTAAIREIRSVIGTYKHLGRDVIKEALQESVVEESQLS